ncbi:beta-lactamase-like protein [Xylariaceae sp. FL0016]|nr:beta-lactamase-like protein [Xylariaceae sp. FL0016]
MSWVTDLKSPPPKIEVHALSAGHFSLPEEQFVHPAVKGARRQVPSLSFLLQHNNPQNGGITRILFDLGLRRDVERYADPIRRHVETRQPMKTLPDVVKSLEMGGLTPRDIDYVMYSHVHWDHVGEPRDFSNSTFVVGHGSLELLTEENSLRGGHSFFESDLLDPSRTIGLSNPRCVEQHGNMSLSSSALSSKADFSRPWTSLQGLPSVLDLFGDGSLYIVDAPGHLPGHINLLANTDTGWLYLAGDTCHDRRIIRGEKEIGEWLDIHGQVCCIHADRAKAEQTIERVRDLERQGVEVILAHDVEWENDPKNRSRFFGASG